MAGGGTMYSMGVCSAQCAVVLCSVVQCGVRRCPSQCSENMSLFGVEQVLWWCRVRVSSVQCSVASGQWLVVSGSARHLTIRNTINRILGS